MVIKTASPGVYIQELDLTRGILDPVTRNNGVLAGPFERGPVDQAVKVSTEVELRQIFGGPTNENYEYWYTIDNFLEYGGQCYVIRCDDAVGDEIDTAIDFFDDNGDEVEVSNVRHPQVMRNSTDAYTFSYSDPSDPTSSEVYLKNDQEWESKLGDIIPGYGKFFARNPGRWMNGVGVAVIDSGADYQLTLADGNPALSVDALLIINGGTAPQEFPDVLVGGTAPKADVDPLLNVVFEREDRAFDPDTLIGQKLTQYVKIKSILTDDEGNSNDTICECSVTDIDLISGGTGFTSNQADTAGESTGWVTNVPCRSLPRDPSSECFGDELGENMFVDLYIEDGVVTAHRLNLRGAAAPTGFCIGDTFETVYENSVDPAVFSVEETRTIGNTVIRIGDNQDGVIGTIIRREKDYYVVAVAPHADGSFGTAEPGQPITDPSINSAVVGVVDEYVVLGYYLFYGSGRGGQVDVIWEPQTYTREQGMDWLWPNRPFGGEHVHRNKIAVNVNGVPIKDNGWTEQDPVYKKLEGPATVTPSSGDTINWHATRERWVQTYVPKQGDIIYDNYVNPEDPSAVVTPFTITDATDWYSQQIAFEGIPWIQFAPRPRTSAHAQDLNCENDEMNIIVYDAEGNHNTLGGAAPQKGRVLETYYQCSKLKGAVTVEGNDNYYQDLINVGSQIIYANEQVDIIGSVVDDGPALQSETINAGKVMPGTVISTGLYCAYIAPRYGSVYAELLPEYTTRISTSGIKKLEITAGGSGFGMSVSRTDQLVTTTGGGATCTDQPSDNPCLKVDYTTNEFGVITAVSPSAGYEGTGFVPGDIIALQSPEDGGLTATFEVKVLVGSPKAPYLLLGGEDQLSASLGELQHAYRKVLTENFGDLDYILQGPAYDPYFFADLASENSIVISYGDKLSYAISKANALISIGEELKTAMVLISPPKSAALDPIESTRITEAIVEWADRIASSSYAVMDSGYKRMYDRFREKFVYVPLNGDIAGCMVRTSLVSQPFFSPGGMNRGQIKNVERLSYDPSKAQRDTLYSHRVNPVVTWPGEGTVLYGDKTTLAYSSAFQRINVRRLFIYCERVIGQFAREVLFEFNDVPTRLNFVNTVNPFMTDVVSKRGATDYLVVCDSSNNTPEVIDRNEFVADIYIKPNRSINFVQLTFVATKTGVSFSEAIGSTRLTSN